ncbi:MAG: hypothetical protein M1831_003829 [Alyxoria varia]|nr:MAG: hypothetical protein M1831_003829 [Alyxoria varia]
MLWHLGSFQSSVLPLASAARSAVPSGGTVLSIHTTQRSKSSSTSKRKAEIEDPDPKLRNLTIRLSYFPSRKLGYAIFGKANGLPVLYFHGFPSSRQNGEVMHRHAVELGVKLVSIDRPGIGLSTFEKNRQYKDWPKTVGHLVSRLGLGKYSVLGSSGGGPYALVCGTGVPTRDGVTFPDKIGVLSGIDPPFIRAKYRYDSERGIRKFLMKVWFGSFVRCLFPESEWVANAFRDGRPSLQPFRQGVKGQLLEWRLQQQDWGFNLSDIKSSVKIWHGKNDVNCSIEGARWMQRSLTRARSTLHEEEGGNHTSQTYDAMTRFVESLVPQSSGAATSTASRPLEAKSATRAPIPKPLHIRVPTEPTKSAGKPSRAGKSGSSSKGKSR